MDSGLGSATNPSTSIANSNPDVSTTEVSGNGAEEYDMFADDDENATAKPSTDENKEISQPPFDALKSDSEGKTSKQKLSFELCYLLFN